MENSGLSVITQIVSKYLQKRHWGLQCDYKNSPWVEWYLGPYTNDLTDYALVMLGPMNTLRWDEWAQQMYLET